jgi:hypothetical protein
MRYLCLMLLAFPLQASEPQIIPVPPAYAYAPCDNDRPVRMVLDPDGRYYPIARADNFPNGDLRLVGYEERLFCDGMED